MIIAGDPASLPQIVAELRGARLADGPLLQSAASGALWRALCGGVPAWAREVSGSFWHALAIVDEAPASQMDALLAACRQRSLPAAPLASLALTGRGFRGQRQRRWTAARGNLHLCVVLPVNRPATTILPALVAVPAVAAVDALRPLGFALQIKWVNDLWLNGAKVGGVLASSICRGKLVEQVVLGIGLNVTIAPELAPTPFVPAVTSLAAHGVAPGVVTLALAVLDRLAAWSTALAGEGSRALVDAYRAVSCVLGRRVVLWDEEADAALGPEAAPLARGRVIAIGDDLSLHLVEPVAHLARGRLALDD